MRCFNFRLISMVQNSLSRNEACLAWLCGWQTCSLTLFLEEATNFCKKLLPNRIKGFRCFWTSRIEWRPFNEQISFWSWFLSYINQFHVILNRRPTNQNFKTSNILWATFSQWKVDYLRLSFCSARLWFKELSCAVNIWKTILITEEWHKGQSKLI